MQAPTTCPALPTPMHAFSRRPTRSLKPVPYAMVCASIALSLAAYGPALSARAAGPLAGLCLPLLNAPACDGTPVSGPATPPATRGTQGMPEAPHEA